MKTIYISVITLLVAALFNACSSSESKTIAELSPIHVKVNKVNGSELQQYVSASGSLQAIHSANTSTRMMGHVEKLFVKVGQEVKKGDILVQINSKDLNAKKAQVEGGIRQAQSAYDNAAKDLERFKILHKKGSASDKELENINTRYEMAKGGLETAKQMKNEVLAQYDYLSIRAPFAGRVINTFVKEGGMANPGHPLVSIESTDQFEAQVMVSEEDIELIEENQKANIQLKSSNQSVQGVVSEVSRSSKNTGGQYLVKITIEDDSTRMLAGMFINAQIAVKGETKNETVMVPKSALVEKGQLKGLYTLGENNTALLRWLRLGKSNGETVEVLSGLSKGETIIIEVEEKLYNGAKVSF